MENNLISDSNFPLETTNSPTNIPPPLRLRPYQIKVVNEALSKNTMAILPTGSGKTLIAVHVIKDRVDKIRNSGGNIKKFIAFLAPTKILVSQQSKYISSHSDAKVIDYTGETTFIEGKSINYWNLVNWEGCFKAVEVIVMTPQIMYQMLQRRFFKIELFDTIIIDECHHAQGYNPLNSICSKIKESLEQPLIFAITASPCLSRKGSVIENMKHLAENLNCSILRVENLIDDFKNCFSTTNLSMFRYKESTFQDIFEYFLSNTNETFSSPQFKEIFNLSFKLPEDSSKLMLFGYTKVRQASIISSIYQFLKNMLMEVEEFQSLQACNFPPKQSITAIRSSNTPDVVNFDRPSYLLKPTNIVNVSSDITQTYSQVLRIVEDSGALAGLYSLYSTLLGKFNVKSLNFSHNSTQRYSKYQKRFHRKLPKKKQEINISHIDTDKIEIYAKELSCSPFKLMDLVHEEYVNCIGLIDLFFSLISLLGSDVSRIASLSYLQSHQRWKRGKYNCMIEISFQDEDRDFFFNQHDKVIYVNRIHAFVYLLFQLVIIGDMKIDPTLEGTISLVSKIWPNFIKDPETLKPIDFKESMTLKESDLKIALSSAITHVLRSIPTDKLKLWSSVDNDDFQYSIESIDVAFRPKYSNQNISLDPLIFFQSFKNSPPLPEIISVKVKALSQIWSLIKAAEDKEAFETNNSMEIEMDNSIDEVAKSALTQTSDSISNSSEPAYLVFLRMRLNAISVHMVLTMILENIYNDDNEIIFDDIETPSPYAEISEESLDIKTSVAQCLEEIIFNITKENPRNERSLNPRFLKMKSNMVSLPSFKPIHLVGQMKQKTQLEALKLFKEGEFNIIFATDVMEEGLDLRACKYVINFDEPVTLKSFVQRKGRSRAENAQMISLVPFGDDGDELLYSIIELYNQEKSIESYTSKKSDGDFVAGILLMESMETVQVNEYNLIDKTNSILQFEGAHDLMNDFLFSSTSRVVEMDDTESQDGESKDQAGNEPILLESEDFLPISNIDSDTLSQDSDSRPLKRIKIESLNEAGLDNEYNKHLEFYKYVVPKTGAEADGRTSTQILLRFCHKLPHDKYYNPRPIFWLTKENNKYSYSILLPPYVPSELRCFVGPMASNKALAKGLASLECIKKLHLHGELNDNLMINGSNQDVILKNNESIESIKKQTKSTENINIRSNKKRKMKEMVSIDLLTNASIIKKVKDENDLTKNDFPIPILEEGRSEEIPEAVDSKKDENYKDSINVDIQIVPEGFAPKHKASTSSLNKEIVVYIYFVQTMFYDDIAEHNILTCNSCQGYYLALNNFCIVLLHPVPEEIIQSSFLGYIKELEAINIKIDYFGSKTISETDLIHLQRFHRGVISWEFDSTLSSVCNSIHNQHHQFIDPFLDISLIYPESLPTAPISYEEWVASSNGSWYIIAPTPSRDLTEVKSLLSTNIEWSSFIRKSADEAQILAYNLSIHRKISEKVIPRPSIINPTINSHADLVDMIIHRGPGGLNVVRKANEETLPRLNDTAKLMNNHEMIIEIKQHVKVSLNSIIDQIESNFINDNGSLIDQVFPVPLVKYKPESNFNEPRGEKNIPISYLDSFSKHYPELWNELEVWANDPKHRIWSIYGISGHLTIHYILSNSKNRLTNRPKTFQMAAKTNFKIRSKKVHDHSHSLYIIPNLVYPLGKSVWYLVGLTAPVVSWRFQSLMLAWEAREHLKIILSSNMISAQREDKGIEQSNQDPNVVNNSHLVYPSIPLMLESLTPRLALELIDSERLEVIGDSVLKLIASIEVFNNFPRKHEGFLTTERSRVINNLFLVELAIQYDLQKFLRAFALSSGKQNLRYRPPGMTFEGIKHSRSLWNKNVGTLDMTSIYEEKNKEIPYLELFSTEELNNLSTIDYFSKIFPRQQFELIESRPKLLADLIESFIGAFYLTGGLDNTSKMIKALRILDPVQPTEIPVEQFIEIKQETLESNSMQNNDELTFPPNFPEPLQRVARGISQHYPLDQAADLLDTQENNLKEADQHKEQLPLPYSSIPRPNTLLFGNQRSMQEKIKGIYESLGYQFINENFLDEALTHCSRQDKPNNQRLEFLGDAVLDLAVMNLLFDYQPWASPGDLSAQKCSLTCNNNIGIFATDLALYKYLSFSSGPLADEFNVYHSRYMRWKTSVSEELASSTECVSSEYALSEFEKDISNQKISYETPQVNAITEPLIPVRPSLCLLKPQAHDIKVDIITEIQIEENPLKKARFSLKETSESQTSLSVNASSQQSNEVAVIAEDIIELASPSTVVSIVGSDSSQTKRVKRKATKKKEELNPIRLSKSGYKAMADLFEALMGAIFLDCGGNLDVIKDVVKKIQLIPDVFGSQASPVPTALP